MKTWKCSTDHVNGDERERVWGEALRQISLPETLVQDHSGFHGDVSAIVSPLGIEFSRVSSSAQILSGACLSRPPCLWLALPIEGVFQLDDGADNVDLRLGDILYGPTGRDSTLKLPDH